MPGVFALILSAVANDRFLKSIALLLAVTLVLALGTLYVLRPKPAPVASPSTVAAALGPISGSIQSLTIHSHASTVGDYIISQSPSPGLYSMDLKSAARSVPAAGKIDSLVRVLLETKITPLEISPSSVPPQDWVDFNDSSKTARLSLATQSGPLWTATVGSPPVAYKAERDVSAILARSSLQQLADTHLAPGLTDRTSDITIQTAGLSVHLVRTPSSWALAAPVTMPADRNTAETTRVLLTELPGVEILWDRDPSDNALGVDTPQATITASTPIHDAATSTPNSLSVTIAIGADADVNAQSVFAKITAFTTQTGTKPIYGPYVVKIERAFLNRIPFAAAEYAARTALTMEAGDIRSLGVGPGGEAASHTFTRTAAGWARDGTALDQSKTADLTKLISILTATRADFVSLTPKTIMPQHSIHIGSTTGTTVQMLNIGKSGENWWIQNTNAELRYRNMNELGQLIESLSR